MDHHHKHGRKPSWDSKMSISTTMSTGAKHYRRSASSILSTDSELRFTRRKLSSQYRCGCCIIIWFLLLLLLAAAAIYVGYTYLAEEHPQKQVFRGTFAVLEGDQYSTELADPSTVVYKNKSRDYQERLNLLFRRSSVRHGFAGTEVLALDGMEDKNLVVHFNVYIDPAYATVSPKELEQILFDDITTDYSHFFQNITIDTNSLHVKENDINEASTTTTLKPKLLTTTQKPKPPRKCTPIQVKYCSNLNYNLTSYPNILGHNDFQDVEVDYIAFRELVDGECYRLAYEFVCQVLQPSCKESHGNEREDQMILPCRSFCRDFMAGCASRLQPKFKALLDCNKFPEFDNCNTKPGCVQELQARALSPRICDGVVDCQDLSDEKSCSYCPSDHIHCGIGRVCINSKKQCDGHVDCPDGSDERACLHLAPSIRNVSDTVSKMATPHQPSYHSEGFVVFNEKGERGKLCIDNLDENGNKTIEVLHNVASSLCKSLGYQKVTSVNIEKDYEPNISYVSMKDPLATEINFVRSACDSRQVLKVGCQQLECGVQKTRSTPGTKTLSKMSIHGDWPWHAALFKDETHLCDATLIAQNWLVSTASCFQAQSVQNLSGWTARFGIVRISSSTPWQQERKIIQHYKSPVEGSTIALIKLESNIITNDFVKPVCLKPPQDVNMKKIGQCNTLGWARNRDQLQRVQLKQLEMEKCENMSISTLNSLCTEAMYGADDCNEEEFAGSPMLCSTSDKEDSWTLIGVSNWRIACSRSGVERPRMYDSILSNVDWILKTMSSLS